MHDWLNKIGLHMVDIKLNLKKQIAHHMNTLQICRVI